MEAAVNHVVYDHTLFWLSTTCGLIGAFIPFLIKMVLRIISRETELEANLRRQLCDLKAELGGISMVDEFAKHAKIQRKVNKVTDELANQSRVRSTFTLKVRIIATSVLYAIMSLTVFILVWRHSKSVILTVPEKWVFPVGSLLSYPTGVSGGISLMAWLFVTGTVGRIFVGYIS